MCIYELLQLMEYWVGGGLGGGLVFGFLFRVGVGGGRALNTSCIE